MGVIGKIRVNTKLYNDCSELPLWNYIEIIKTKDLKHLIKSGSVPKKSILVSKMEEINKELSELRGEKTMTSKFDLMSYKEELELSVKFGIVLSNRLHERIKANFISPELFEALITELDSWGFTVNRDNPIIDELDIISSDIKALQTTIESLQAEIYPEQEETEIQEGNEILEFYTMLLVYQRILSIDKIRTKETTMLEFIAIERQVKEVINKRKTEQ